MPQAYCGEMSHANKDRHAYDEDCPIVERHNKLIDRASIFLLATLGEEPEGL